MSQLDLFPNTGIKEEDRLYVIGNGFDIHHGIESKYCDFRKWVLKDDKNSSVVGLMDEELLFPCQNAYSSVIRIMNEWEKEPQNLIDKYKSFFQSLKNCKGVCVLGLSYSDIDTPYLNEIADTVASDCKWLLYYHTEEDKKRAIDFAKDKELMNYTLKNIE